MRQAVLLALLVLAAPLTAAEAKKPRTDLMRQYIYLKDDSDLFVGEGVAELKDFDGSVPKAVDAARLRAKAALAEAVRARISSSTVEKSEFKDGKAKEAISSNASSQADVSLENMKLKELVDFPELGQVTVLASVAKEDYRRQLAGKGPRVYRPESGLRLIYSATTLFETQRFVKDEDAKVRKGGLTFKTDGSNGNTGASAGSNPDSVEGPALEFRFRDWSLLVELGLAKVTFYPYDPAEGKYARREGATLDIFSVGVGYDWTPWAWKVQPYLPLGLRYTYLNLGDYEGGAPSATAGLGLRYWPNDSLALDLSGRYLQGLTKAALNREGKQLFSAPNTVFEPSFTGAQWQISVLWSGF